MKKQHVILKFIPMILIMVMIFYFSSRVGDESSVQSGFIVDLIRRICNKLFDVSFAESAINLLTKIVRKSAHFTEYALLGWFTVYAIRGLVKRKWPACIFAEAIVFLYAVSDEFHQYFVPGRSSSPVDVGIDSLGALLGIWLYMLAAVIIDRIRKKKRQKKSLRSS